MMHSLPPCIPSDPAPILQPTIHSYPSLATVTRILLTAFEPYDRWKENSSWLALMDLTNWYKGDLDITTRRYPVDLPKMKCQLGKSVV